MSSKLSTDDDWVTFLIDQRLEVFDFDEKLPASMRQADIIKDATKYRHGANPAFFNARAWDLAEKMLHLHYQPILGSSDITPPSDALLDFRLTTSSTYQGKLVGPYKEDLLRQLFDAHNPSSALLSQLVSSLDLIFSESVSPSEFHEHMLTTKSFDKVVGKDELRSRQKLVNGSVATRSFIVPALDVFILEKMLLSDQFDRLLAHSVRKQQGFWEPLNVGIPIQHRGYDTIIRETNKYPHRISFDTDKHDGRVRCEHFELLARFHFAMLRASQRTSGNWNALQYIYWHAFSALTVLPDGRHAYRFSGQPSGRFGTLVDNSLITLINHFYAFARSHPEISDASELLSLMRREVYLNIMGDDAHLSHSLAEDVLGVYVSAFAELNFQLTTEPSTTFCSSNFAYDEQSDCFYLSHPPDQSLSAMLYKRKNLQISELVLQYARVCGHLDMATSLDPVARQNGKELTLHELLSLFLDWLENRLVRGVPFSQTHLFSRYALGSLRRTQTEVFDLYYKPVAA